MNHQFLSPKRRWIAELRGWIALLLVVFGFHSLIAKPFYIPSESMMPGLLVGDRLVVSKFAYGWSYASASFHLLPFLHGRLFNTAPKRGDVVILDRRGDDGHRSDLIKRVIGLPGDTVQMVGGRLWLNHKPVATRDLGERAMPIDGNFHCDANDPDPARRFPGFINARSVDAAGNATCRLHILRETLAGGRSFDTIDFGPNETDDTAPVVVPVGQIFVMGDNRDDSADSRVPTEYGGLGGAIPIEAIGGRAEFITFSSNGNATWDPSTWWGGLRSSRSGKSLRTVE